MFQTEGSYPTYYKITTATDLRRMYQKERNKLRIFILLDFHGHQLQLEGYWVYVLSTDQTVIVKI